MNLKQVCAWVMFILLKLAAYLWTWGQLFGDLLHVIKKLLIKSAKINFFSFKQINKSNAGVWPAEPICFNSHIESVTKAFFRI